MPRERTPLSHNPSEALGSDPTAGCWSPPLLQTTAEVHSRPCLHRDHLLAFSIFLSLKYVSLSFHFVSFELHVNMNETVYIPLSISSVQYFYEVNPALYVAVILSLILPYSIPVYDCITIYGFCSWCCLICFQSGALGNNRAMKSSCIGPLVHIGTHLLDVHQAGNSGSAVWIYVTLENKAKHFQLAEGALQLLYLCTKPCDLFSSFLILAILVFVHCSLIILYFDFPVY